MIGRLQVRSWDDNEGKKRWSTDVVVEEQYFAESKASFERNSSAAPANTSAGGVQTGTQNGKQMDLSSNDGFYPIDESIEDDDLPF